MSQQRHQTTPRRPSQPRKPAQHHPAPRRESDLQPVYDFLDAIRPSNLRAAWRRTNRHTRWLMIFTVAGVVLLWSVLRISIMVANHIDATTGPFLWDALRAPYNLEKRFVPAVDPNADLETIALLPATIGEFTLQPEVEAVEETATEQAVDQAASEPVSEPSPEAVTADSAAEGAITAEQTAGAEAAVTETPVPEIPVIVYPVSDCLYAGGTPVDKAACVTAAAQYIESGTYQNAEGTAIRVTVAQFASDSEATQVAKDLHRYAFTIGSVGNFALGVGQVDFFYSTITDQYSFVWSHENWVYTASGPVFDDVEALVKAFPY
jgi:hypothetical protein